MSTNTERTLQARIAAHESWSRTPDRAARTAKARDALLNKFDRLVDPDGLLTEEERAWRAQQARKAHYTRMALKSAQSRQRRAKSRTGGEG